MEIDPATRDARTNYHFLTSTIVPRPIAWVTTVGKDGVVNAAPFSWFNSVCADPPMLMLAIQQRPDGTPKDTLRNIQANGELVVNLAPRSAVQDLVQSSGDYPPDVSEVEALGLATTPSLKVRPPRLAASPIHFECRVHQQIPLGHKQATTLVLAEAIHIAIDDAILDARGNADPAKWTAVARMGGAEYVDTQRYFTVKRPKAPGASHTGELPT